MKNIKRPTIRFYTSSDQYHGFKFLSDVTYFKLSSWLKSGNYLKYKEEIISGFNSNQIFALLRKGK